MYLAHYKLNQMPFQITPDPKFLWLGEKHKEALAILKYGVLNNHGFLLLTGDVGTGKTTLINTFVNSLGPDTLFINITDPRFNKLDFFKLVAHSFGLESTLATKFDFFIAFKNFLNRAHENNKRVLLIVDEAQRLSMDSLEEIRLLSNIERQDSKLLNIFFLGQKEFNATLLRPESRALRQRITIGYHIEPLNEKETGEYVKYRLSIAGAQREIFKGRALKKIHAISGGYPRLINTVCDLALVTGYTEDLQTIGPKVIRECAKKISLPGETRKQLSRGAASRKKTGLSRLTKAAILSGLAVLVILLYFIIAPRFLGDPEFSLGKYYGPLFGGAASNSSQRSPGKSQSTETEHSSPPPAPALPSSESGTPGVSKSPHQETKIPGSGNIGNLETAGQDNPLPEGRLVIPFGYNANELPPDILARLDELAGYMLRRPQSEIVIKGYTDAAGSPDYNKSLSAFRANVVKSYLAGKGINPNRMRVIGMGGGAPRKPNTTSEGRSANRRVEIELVPPQS